MGCHVVQWPFVIAFEWSRAAHVHIQYVTSLRRSCNNRTELHNKSVECIFCPMRAFIINYHRLHLDRLY